MAFLTFPIYFIEDEDEKMENLGLPPNRKEGEITVNTQMICAYNETDRGTTMLRLANGDCVECPLDLKSFEDILANTENIFDLTTMGEN